MTSYSQHQLSEFRLAKPRFSSEKVGPFRIVGSKQGSSITQKTYFRKNSQNLRHNFADLRHTLTTIFEVSLFQNVYSRFVRFQRLSVKRNNP